MGRRSYYGRTGVAAALGAGIAFVAGKATKTLGVGILVAGGKGVGVAALPALLVAGAVTAVCCLHVNDGPRRYSWQR